MGMLIHIKGDLFETTCPIIAHGCNILGGFGSGVAGIIAQRYPKAREMYMQRHKDKGWELGFVQIVQISPTRQIANMATQPTYGYEGQRHVSYDAVDECFQILLKYAEDSGQDVAIPRIGAGLGGGSWNVIEAIICEHLKKYDVTVKCYTLE